MRARARADQTRNSAQPLTLTLSPSPGRGKHFRHDATWGVLENPPPVRTSPLLLWLLVIGFALAALGGCTLLTNFDPEGQPCDVGAPNYADQCVADAGYSCVNGLCTRDGGH